MIQNPETPPVVVADQPMQERGMDLRVYLGVLLKYRWSILGIAILAGIIGLYSALKAVPIYSASAKLQIERNDQNSALAAQFGTLYYDWEFYETQYQLIQSWGVAELTAKKMGLFDAVPVTDKAPLKSGFSLNWRDWLPESMRPIPRSMSPEEHRANLIASVQGAIKVRPVENSQLASIVIEHPDPARAAEYANYAAESYVEFLKDKNLENLQSDQIWYASRLDTAKQELDEANLALQQFYERQGLIQAGQGANSIKAQALQSALSGQGEARTRRQTLQRVYRDIENARNGQGSLDTITELESRGVVRALKTTVVQSRQRVNELSQRYGPKHPTMIEAQTGLENAEREFTSELERVADSVVADYRRAQAAEQTYSQQVASAENEIRALDRNRAEQTKLEDAVATSRAIFEKLQSGEQTSSMLGGGSQKPNVTIIERARPNYTPVRPDKRRMVMVAALVGLMLGIGLAFLLDHLDNTFKGPEDVEKRLGLPVLGSLPKLKLEKDDKLQPMREFQESHKSAFSESIRTIRTGAMLSGLDREQNVVMVTSSVPGEGKTTLSLNLAHAIGQMKKTLLIDADMRRPMVGKAQSLDKAQPGLASFVTGEHSFEQCVTHSEDADLTIMHAGSIPPNPLELLASKRFERILEELRKTYEYIILDCAPALAVSDALVVSRMSDAVLYVIRADGTPFQAAEEGMRRLRRANAPVLGAVLNHVQTRGRGYYGKYYRYGYRYRYGYYNSNYYHDYYGHGDKS
ncbi:MAG: polysaccharide biosynthesis tyrosine autokinase [Xanthomonadales bacterium]|nr:polysaccharide biosynthesis tyrosine autokinase [Xanthomonadales bacterium]NNL94731.1 polysaccharide biosynthesis tyrosine autokinase [Xanthomonadales bacterium]